MKKILSLVLFVLALVIMPSNAYASDKVTIYFFRGDECPHCEEGLEYINEHKKEIGENIEVVTYETWSNSDNAQLLRAVADKLGEESDNVPLIVIGEEYILGYSGVSTYNEIMDIANSYVDSDEYKDIVKDTIKELEQEDSNLDFKALGLEDLYSEPSMVASIIVYSIFGLIVVGFILMMVFSKK